MRRRALLSLLATGLAGCTAPLSNSPEPTATTEGSQTLAAADYELHVAEPRVRASVVAVVTSGTHLGVLDEPNTQYLVVHVERSDSRSVTDAPLRMTLDGEAVSDSVRWVGRPESEADGRIAIPVPVQDATEGKLVLGPPGDPVDQFPLDAETVETLGNAPAFEVTAFDVPQEVAAGEQFEASFRVTNDGDRDGRFLTEFGNAQLSDTGEVAVRVPAGGAESYTGTIEPYYDPRPETIPVVLDWGLERRREEVPVAYDSTPTATDEPTPTGTDAGSGSGEPTPTPETPERQTTWTEDSTPTRQPTPSRTETATSTPRQATYTPGHDSPVPPEESSTETPQ